MLKVYQLTEISKMHSNAHTSIMMETTDGVEKSKIKDVRHKKAC